MSFEEQERALFDLLFDRKLRAQFCQDPAMALAQYELETAERSDFDAIRPDALEIDATMRANLILSQLCQSFPLTFSLVSSLKDGLATIKGLVDTQTMRNSPVDRATTLGTRLREQLTQYHFDSEKEQTIVIAILEAELGMAWTSAALKHEVLQHGPAAVNQSSLTPDWSAQPVKLAAFVSAALIPQPYQRLKKLLCNGTDSALWRRLGRTPLPDSTRKRLLQQEDPRLLIARAHVSQVSRCEPTIEHKTVELSEGFAHLFQHVNGTTSVESILVQMKQAGADESILQSIQAGFQQLLETGMLELINQIK